MDNLQRDRNISKTDEEAVEPSVKETPFTAGSIIISMHCGFCQISVVLRHAQSRLTAHRGACIFTALARQSLFITGASVQGGFTHFFFWGFACLLFLNLIRSTCFRLDLKNKHLKPLTVIQDLALPGIVANCTRDSDGETDSERGHQ